MNIEEIVFDSDSDEDVVERICAEAAMEAELEEQRLDSSGGTEPADAEVESPFSGFEATEISTSGKENQVVQNASEKIVRVMKHLTVTTKELDNFDPELSRRERRKLNFRLNNDQVRALQGHNENGIIIGTDKDLCDCLNEDCPGCFFPCWTCRSCKCGNDCRNDRKFILEATEDVADGSITENPFLRRQL